MNPIAQKAISLVEGRFVKLATVLAFREWSPATFLEIDLHMPGCDMYNWKDAMHMKCKVGSFSYRDYSISCWDGETQTCTLLISTGHEGAGSQWAKTLKRGDKVYYAGISSSHQRPEKDKQLVLLGDETAIGHFLALRQLAGREAAICGALAIGEKNHQEEFRRYFPDLILETVDQRYPGDLSGLEDWAGGFNLQGLSDVIFYLAGYSPAMVRIRKILRSRGIENNQVKIQQFWN